MRKFLAFLPAIVLVLLSCDHDPMSIEINPFVGTWVHENGEVRAFTDTTVVITLGNGDIWLTGNYTFDSHNIFVTADLENNLTGQLHHSWAWAMNGGMLFLQGIPFSLLSNIEPETDPFTGKWVHTMFPLDIQLEFTDNVVTLYRFGEDIHALPDNVAWFGDFVIDNDIMLITWPLNYPRWGTPSTVWYVNDAGDMIPTSRLSWELRHNILHLIDVGSDSSGWNNSFRR